MFVRCCCLVFVALQSLCCVEPAWVAEVRSACQEDLSAQALPLAQALPAVEIDAQYDPALGRVSGSMRAWITNDSGKDWASLAFAVHANNERSFLGSSLNVTSVRCAGKLARWTWIHERRGLTIALAERLQPGEGVSCELKWECQLAPQGGGRAGLLAQGAWAHTLYNWLPEPAIYRDGWEFPALQLFSDPSYVRSCDYALRLRLPDDWLLRAGGIEFESVPGEWTVANARSRNLALWVAPRANLSTFSAMGGNESGNKVEVHVTVPREREGLAKIAAQIGVEAISMAQVLFGPYPRRSYDIVLSDFNEMIGGMEASGLTFINRQIAYDMFQVVDDIQKLKVSDPLLQAIVHEILHSWWYDQVGSDPGAEPWLDEALTQWCTWHVLEYIHSEGAFNRLAYEHASMLLMVVGDEAPMTISGYEMTEMQLWLMLYVRGPMMYEVLRRKVGDEAFFAACQLWYKTFSGTVAYRSDWETVFLSLLPEEERQPFVDVWLDGDEDLLPQEVDEFINPQYTKIIRDSITLVRKAKAEKAAEKAAKKALGKNGQR